VVTLPTPERWRDGQVVLRWVAAGTGEAAKQFRRVDGYLHPPALRVALNQTVAAGTPTKQDAARPPVGPPPTFHGDRDILLTGLLRGNEERRCGGWEGWTTASRDLAFGYRWR
jgi:hypothetical protein